MKVFGDAAAQRRAAPRLYQLELFGLSFANAKACVGRASRRASISAQWRIVMAVIRRLNYQHLLYFWSVVRTGSLTRACEELSLSAPTVSSQLRTLEERLGEKLLAKSGRNLVPTEVGKLVYGYANEIFTLGQEMLDALEHRPSPP